jgi:hypothetical protein
MFAAKEFSATATMGMVVIVYDINPLTETERRSPSSVRERAPTCNENESPEMKRKARTGESCQ